MDPNVKLYEDQGELLSNLERYRCLAGKLKYNYSLRYIICNQCFEPVYERSSSSTLGGNYSNYEVS